MGPERIYPPRLREEQAAEEQRELTRQRRRRFALFLVVGLLLLALLGFLGYGLLNRMSLGAREEASGEVAYRLPEGEHLQVEVLNACGVPGVAETAAAHLRRAGFDVPAYGNAAGPEPFSLVVDRVGDSRAALRVARALGIPRERIVRRIDSSRYVHATILLGRDHPSLIPFE